MTFTEESLSSLLGNISVFHHARALQLQLHAPFQSMEPWIPPFSLALLWPMCRRGIFCFDRCWARGGLWFTSMRSRSDTVKPQEEFCLERWILGLSRSGQTIWLSTSTAQVSGFFLFRCQSEIWAKLKLMTWHQAKNFYILREQQKRCLSSVLFELQMLPPSQTDSELFIFSRFHFLTCVFL